MKFCKNVWQESENLLDSAFLSIASNNYVDALSYLENANNLSPGK